ENQGKKSNHQSFFIAPTIKNVVEGDTIQSGYTIENGQRVFLYEAFKKSLERTETKMEKAAFFATSQDNRGLLLNDGTLCPPCGNN
ncbi:MAG: hypothetical protein KDC56_08710, partial [Flavobacteriaceae bacterium]|nr:hypothetical protein [Flavobacteriaceae bacterium]